MSAPHSHAPLSERFGAGFYSDNTIGCYNVVENGTALALEALRTTKVDTERGYVIADYGTADGGTSMHLMRFCVEDLRAKHGKDLPISIWYEDQPNNDFKSLFLRLQGLIPGPPKFLDENVHIYANGTSFFEPCFPRGSVDLGVCFTAMHWLNGSPGQLKDAIHHSISKDEECKAEFAKLGAKCWTQILTHRAKEMKVGAKMLVVNFCLDEKNQCLGQTFREGGPTASMYSTKDSIWKQMAAEGKIKESEYAATTFYNYYRSDKEHLAPLKDGKNEDMRLKLVSFETKVTACPYHASWLKADHGGRTAEEQGKWFVPTTRTWSDTTYRNGLESTRTEAEKDALVDELFDRYAAEVAKDPSKHGMDYVHAYIVVEKY